MTDAEKPMPAEAVTPETTHHEARLHHLSTRVRIIRDTFEILAFTAAGIWGLYTFWYQTSFAPAHAAPALEWKVSLAIEGERADGVLAVRAQIHGRNSGKATEQVAAVAVNLFGDHVKALDGGAAAATFATIPANATSWEREIGASTDAPTLVATRAQRYGGDLGDLMIRPDEDVTVDMDLLVPRADYDRLIGRLAVFSIRGKAEIRPEWFDVKRTEDGVLPVASDSCRATDACEVAENTDFTSLTLWTDKPALHPPAAAPLAAPSAVPTPSPAPQKPTVRNPGVNWAF